MFCATCGEPRKCRDVLPTPTNVMETMPLCAELWMYTMAWRLAAFSGAVHWGWNSEQERKR